MQLSAEQFGRLYRAIQQRDSRLDGQFWVAVRTTGIYCLPSCRGRKPNAENVHFYDSRSDAEAAGFRPCRKCHPEVLGGRRELERRSVRAWLEALAESDQPMRQVAQQNGASTSQLYRRFRRHLGRSPRQARAEARLRRACDLLRMGKMRVVDVAYDAGFGSLATFYRWFRRETGMTPTEFVKQNRGKPSWRAQVHREQENEKAQKNGDEHNGNGRENH